MGFEEISHTADWSVRVWAPDLPELFAESARAMNSLAGVVLAKEPRTSKNFESQGPDAESLLVAFLSELVYLQEQDHGLAFDRFDVKVESPAKRPRLARDLRDGIESAHKKLKVEMEGAQIISADKAIKAVTYHNMKVEETTRGVEVVIVFDV